ncbi:T-cell immunoreceptor with Ig and ITIM domains [Pteropus medius]|uniref:T-cell immunoreceptor with Ig and ITIM domains n=1 Tax=Pteropus vampyrus TaxID=132908 RepID=UPI00196AA228|nr:T-cell immunoreceptor with Ig and ITIM domains [Pteropus giganteus]
MQWCLLLIWAQGLRQTPLLVSGAVTGRIVTVGNISAEEGGSVNLQCHLSFTTAAVTQVNWEQQDKLLAIHHAKLGWHTSPAFRERVVPGSDLSLTLHSLTANDTGEYFCIYYTFPDGMYKGRIFLKVLLNSEAEHSSRFLTPLLGATALVIICIAVIAAIALARKKKFLRTHSVESDLRRPASAQEEWGPSMLSPHGNRVQVEVVPAGLYREQRGDDYAEQHDYFNVLSYRSLGSLSFPAEMD